MKGNNKNQKAVSGYVRGYKKENDNSPKVEAKPEYGYKSAVPVGQYNNLVLVAIILLLMFIVTALLYAVYIFFHGSRLVDTANIHVTSNLKKAAGEIGSFFKLR